MSFSYIPKDKPDIYTNKYPKEFLKNSKGELYCKLCRSTINSDRKSTVDKHRETKKHSTELAVLNSIKSMEEPLANSCRSAKNEFLDRVVRAFLAADIAFNKLNVPELAELFDFMGYKIPAETTARTYVLNYFAKENFTRLKDILKNKKIFLIVDEGDVDGTRYFNIISNYRRARKNTF